MRDLGGREGSRLRPRALVKARLGLACALVASVVVGCQQERAHAERRSGEATRDANNAAPAAPAMVVEVAQVRGDANIDPIAVGRTLRGAETALLSCVDSDGSTGVLALKFVIERPGSVGDLKELSTTTYGSEASRICMQKIVAAMQFPTVDGRGETEVTLEIRSRH